MRRTVLLVIAFVSISFQGFSQAYESTVDYLKKKEQAIAIDFPYPSKVVEDAIVEKLEKMGLKTKSSKGFYSYKNTVISDISNNSKEYIFSVERKSRKEKDESVVYLIMKANSLDAASGDLEGDNNNAKTFLNDLAPYVEAYNLEVEIKDQDAEVAKAEKKLKKLEDDNDDLNKKLKKLEDNIKENESDQEKQQAEIEKQKGILGALKDKRKN